MSIHKIAFMGAGSIAEAVIAGLIQTRFVKGSQITVSNRSNQERLIYFRNTYGVHGTHDKKELLKDADIIFFAMKPKDAAEAVSSVKDYVQDRQLIISLMAGVSTASITNLLEKNNPIIRAMPNTSAAILKSATAISPSVHATEMHIAMARALFEKIGVVSVVNEEQMHAVTALSGSGPAYIYYVVEAMEKAAREIGLTEDISKPLILQTIIGAAEMLKTTPKHPSILRKEITSPGGTTQAGIEVLESCGFQAALIQCITRATTRSHELGETLANLLEK
ncbi:pyrroline-5-carboxylate reductase ProI [Ectobacillus panaciterrae]|uniref:pyrroline-5-carboxylate reductase ProI n=1 Tax=Ectobacillus panaciterrae TaxID=363872 RepID=UPI00040976C6|nr:pyrroline-5-carboxylate reductase ProI [Ectobacillus panaciterrae]